MANGGVQHDTTQKNGKIAKMVKTLKNMTVFWGGQLKNIAFFMC